MIRIDLRAEAESEAARIRAIKARPPNALSVHPWTGIPAARLRRPAAAGLHRSAAIFFIRTSIADGSGRLVEELLTPVEVGGVAGGDPQNLFDRWHALVRSVGLAEVAKRMTELAWEYRHGLERARTREAHLEELARADRGGLVQPGLFDRRAMNDRSAVPDDQRQASLTTASSLLVAQHSDVVLLVVIN